MLRSAFLATLLTSGSAQDQKTPAQFVGTWVGARKQTFGQVDVAQNPDALECVANELTSPSQTMTIGSVNVNLCVRGC